MAQGSTQMLNIPEREIYQTIHSYIKQYPEFARLYEYDSPVEARLSGFELKNPKKRAKSAFTNPVALLDSLRRSKTHISDIVLSNRFDMFCTFTFDPNKTNRQDPDLCKKKMSKWLKNQREKWGAFDYLIIPEFHKDKKSLHFHALFNNYKGKTTTTGKLHKGKQLYSIKSYKLGFSDLKYINQTDQDIQKVSSYIKKYITKDMPQFAGKKRYWCSTNLNRPKIQHNPELDPFTRQTFQRIYELKNLTISFAQGTIPTLNNLRELNKWPPKKV
jgi:hypothetical protein